MLFIIVCLLFSSSRPLLNVSCIFCILFPRFGIIFTVWFLIYCLILLWFLFHIDCLFPLHLFGLVGFYLAPSSAVYFSVFSFCLTYCVWWSPFCRLQVRSSRCFWCLPPMGKLGSVGCVGFLVEGTGACVLVDEAGSCLSGGQDCIRWCVLGCLWT